MRSFLLILFVFPYGLSAQKDAAAGGLPLLTFKTNVTALLNPVKQAYAFGADIRLGSRMTADVGAGAFLGSPLQFASHKGETYKGLRLRAGLKYYLVQKGRSAFHLGMEGKVHNIKHFRFWEVLRQGQQYTEFLLVERKIDTQGLASRAGLQIFLGEKRRFFIEPYAGLGLLFNTVKLQLPPDAEIINDGGIFVFEFEPGRRVSPDLIVGLHFGVAMW